MKWFVVFVLALVLVSCGEKSDFTIVMELSNSIERSDSSLSSAVNEAMSEAYQTDDPDELRMILEELADSVYCYLEDENMRNLIDELKDRTNVE